MLWFSKESGSSCGLHKVGVFWCTLHGDYRSGRVSVRIFFPFVFASLGLGFVVLCVCVCVLKFG